ncbi:hypothetical protein BT69DRAFT_384904 [Atractiella rhizophila]|nr:hypothetical protein BT69DRAFT_384904 [Atractiella rhizophila]
MAGVQHLTPLHHLFLQSLLSHRCLLTWAQGNKIFRRCKELTESQYEHNLKSFISELNNGLHPLKLRVEEATDEEIDVDGELDDIYINRIIVLVNVEGDDAVAQLATTLTPLEISYFRQMVEGIFSTGDSYYLRHHEALSVASHPKVKPGTLTKTGAEDVLRKLVYLGWLLEREVGEGATIYLLSPRSLHELNNTLKTNYGEDEEGNAGLKGGWVECEYHNCRKVVTNGLKCPHVGCTARFHRFCLKRHQKEMNARNQNQPVKCPACQRNMPKTDAAFEEIGPGAEHVFNLEWDEDEEQSQPKTHTQTRRGKKEKEKGSDDDDEEEEDEDGEDEEDEEEPSQRSGKKGKKTRKEDEMDVDEDEDEDEKQSPLKTTTRPTRRSARKKAVESSDDEDE